MAGELTFDEATHTYRVDGRIVPSVTQILKRVYPDVYAGIPPAVLERKAMLGTAVHKAIELELCGRLDYTTIHEKVQPYFESFMQWWVEQNARNSAQERQFYCEAGGYAGTIDFEGLLNDVAWLVDWKITGTKVKTHSIQLGGYGFGRNPSARVGALYLKEDGSRAELVEYELKSILPDWLSTLRVFNISERMR